MLTPTEVRERLRAAGQCYQNDDSDAAVSVLIGLLYDVLPELVALSSGRSLEDAGSRYRDEVGGD